MTSRRAARTPAGRAARARTGRPPLHLVTLALTGECNLKCRYCYQNAKSSARMPWPVLEASARRLLDTTSPYVDVVFAGGEPLLALDLIERAVDYIESRRRPGVIVRYSLATNGTLLDRNAVAFLRDHRFEIELSFDGVAPAQDVRGRQTFARIDEAIDRMHADAPDLVRRRLTVGITLDADAVPYLSASFSYFLGKRLPAIVITQAVGQNARWTPRVRGALDRELKKVYRTSRDYYRRTGEVPLIPFRKTPGGVPASRGFVCGAAGPGSVTIDVDGQAYACPMFAESSQRFANPRLAAAVQPMRLGHIAHRDFWRTLAELPARAEETRMFRIGPERRSLHGRCVECPHHLECRACPVSVLSEPEHDDAQRIPDYICAFNWTLMSLREKFPVQPDDAAPLGLAVAASSGRPVIDGGKRPRSGAPAPS